MKKYLSLLLMILFLFIVGCEVSNAKQYSLDLSALPEIIYVQDFNISDIKIKIEESNGTISYVNCDESMFTADDYALLKTPGKHTVTVIYKLYKEQFEITLLDKNDITEITYTYQIDLSLLNKDIYIDDFELEFIRIKQIASNGEVEYIRCDETMLSSSDLNKLNTIGTHTITINYKDYSEQITIMLIEKNDVNPVTYTYKVDLTLLVSTYIDDFNVSLIRIKETSSEGNVKFINCDETMLSSSDLNKLNTIGTHTITINYKDYSEQITITLIKRNDAQEEGKFYSTNSYYANANGLSGVELKRSLRIIITNSHKKETTYAELKTYLQKADEDPNNSSNMLLFYTGVSVKKTSNMNTWNREHVWAQSLTGGWFGTSGAGADMHHIRPCNPSVNSSRGNKKFGTASGYYDPSKQGADYRGDVARIIFYMFTRYSEADKHTFKSIAQSQELLLEWNKLDPVSETEIIRNNYTYTVQGNRNPFIDHPECADLIWGSSNLLKLNEFNDIINVVLYFEERRKSIFL